MNEVTKLSGTRFKNFFIHLCKSAKATEEKKRQKAEISRHLERIKSFYFEKGIGRKKIEDEIRLLSSKINEIIDKEKQITKTQEEEETLLKKLQARVEQIGVTPLPQTKEIEDFQRISGILQENISRIKELAQEMVKEEKERLAKIEEKVENEARLTESEIKEIEKKLNLLEKEYKRLRGKGKKRKIEKIGAKIKKQKEILKKLKHS